MAFYKTFFIWLVPVKINLFLLSLSHVSSQEPLVLLSRDVCLWLHLLQNTFIIDFLKWKISVMRRWKPFIQDTSILIQVFGRMFSWPIRKRQRETWTEKLTAWYDRRLYNFSTSQKQPITLVPHRILPVTISKWVVNLIGCLLSSVACWVGELILHTESQCKPPLTDSVTVESKSWSETFIWMLTWTLFSPSFLKLSAICLQVMPAA